MAHDPNCRCLDAVALAAERHRDAGVDRVRAIGLARQHGASYRQIADRTGEGREAIRSICAALALEEANGTAPGTGDEPAKTERAEPGAVGHTTEDEDPGLVIPSAEDVAGLTIPPAAGVPEDAPDPVGLGGLT